MHPTTAMATERGRGGKSGQIKRMKERRENERARSNVLMGGRRKPARWPVGCCLLASCLLPPAHAARQRLGRRRWRRRRLRRGEGIYYMYFVQRNVAVPLPSLPSAVCSRPPDFLNVRVEKTSARIASRGTDPNLKLKRRTFERRNETIVEGTGWFLVWLGLAKMAIWLQFGLIFGNTNAMHNSTSNVINLRRIGW